MSLRDPDTLNAAADELWAAFARRENTRVPITFASDESLWLKLTGDTYRAFYADPRVHVNAQLAGCGWYADHVVHDQRVGPAEAGWTVSPRFWMDEPEFFGCEVMLQDDSFAWSKPLEGSKADILQHLASVDARERVQRGTLWRLYQETRGLCEGMTFRDLPVTVASGAGGGTHGLFTIACHVRGVETLCTDLLEAPGFADEFLALIATKTVERIQAWHELAGTGVTLPLPGGWGIADDSIQLLSAETYRRRVLPHHQRLYATMTGGDRHMHLCGHATQHFPALHDDLGIRALDGPGPFVDHGALFAQYPDLRISGQVDHTVLLLGPESAIEAMMRGLLTDTAKQPGRFSLLGYIGPETPLSHVEAMYQYGRRYGQIA